MSKKVKILIGSLVAVGVLTASIVGVAVADSGNDDGCTGACCEQWAGGRGHGFGRVLCEDVCELLGLSREEIRDRLADGSSLVDIAEEQGVSEDDLVEAIMGRAREAVQSRVEEGVLDGERAGFVRERMEQVVRLMINREGLGPPVRPESWRGKGAWGEAMGPGACGKGMGPGAMQGLGGTTLKGRATTVG